MPEPHRKRQFGEGRGEPQPKAQAGLSSNSEQILIGILLSLLGRGVRWIFGTGPVPKSFRAPYPKKMCVQGGIRTTPQTTPSVCDLAAEDN
jgi:hypothetical protein